MRNRRKMGRKRARKDFTRKASYTHKKNLNTGSSAMRGGIRL